MSERMVALVFDEIGRQNLDLVRALYDKDRVDIAPPVVPLVDPFEEGTTTEELSQLVGLIVSAHQPFVLAMGQAERYFDGDEQLLQFIAGDGADACQRLAAGLYRDVFPHHEPDPPQRSPLERTAVTVGRFTREGEADDAARELGDKSYFLVMAEVAMLQSVGEDGGWDVMRTYPLGSFTDLTALAVLCGNWATIGPIRRVFPIDGSTVPKYVRGALRLADDFGRTAGRGAHHARRDHIQPVRCRGT